MMRAVILVAVHLWLVTKAIAWMLPSHNLGIGQFNCSSLRSSDCSCNSGEGNSGEVFCPQLVLMINLETKLISFTCTTYDDPSAFSILSGLRIYDNESYTVYFSRCPLPDTSFREVVESIGVKRLRSLQILSDSNYKDTLQKKHFEKLYSVTKLRLTNSGLTSLPRDVFEDMGNLTWLEMRNNNIDLPKEIFNFTPNLEILELGQNNLTHLVPGVFKNLHHLRLLNLWDNRLVNLSRAVFSDVPNLESLDLHSNKMETIRPDLFADLIKLRRLNLFANAFPSLPQGLLSRNTYLEEFQMQDNKRPVTLPTGFFSNLTALKTVRLSGSKLTSLPENTFSASKNIQVIYLNRNNLKTLEQKIFADLENLTHLDLSQNQIEYLPGELFSRTKNLLVLKLQYNLLEEINPGLFLHTSQLEFIDLRYNQIKEIKGGFNKLVNLKALNISDNLLTNITPIQFDDFNYSVFHACTKLEDLQLANNSLTEIHFDWKLLMSNLHTLNLAFNQFTKVEADDLDFKRDVSIDLSHNQIKIVNFWKVEITAISRLEDFKTSYDRDSQTIPKRVNLDHNPFNCDCVIFKFVKFLRNELDPEVNYLFEIRSDNLFCKEPKHLENLPLSRVPYKLLTCDLKNISALYMCPDGCTCEYSPFDYGNIVNCQHAGFEQIPQNMSEYMFANHSELILEGNKLQHFELPDDASFKNITHFNLCNNSLTSLSVNHFSPKIKELDVSHNNMETLSDETIVFLNQAKELKVLKIQGNPWRCDCDAMPLIFLIKSRFTEVKNYDNITCSDGRIMSKLGESDFCPEKTSGLIIFCIVFAIFGFLIAILTALYFRYRKEIHIYCFSSKWKILRWLVSHPDNVDENKKYDAFISFSHEDDKFVSEKLVPYLEENEDTKFKLCLHYRDWVPGESIPNQILRSVQASHRTIVVLSPNFLESVWGKVEFRTAHAEALKDGTSRVIIILYEDVGPINALDDDLKAYLQMNSYVKWGSPWFWQQLKYALPHPPEDADDIKFALCCCSKPETDSGSHEVLQHVHIKDGEVHYGMSDISDKVNGKDKNISSSEVPLIKEPFDTKTKEPSLQNHQNKKNSA